MRSFERATGVKLKSDTNLELMQEKAACVSMSAECQFCPTCICVVKGRSGDEAGWAPAVPNPPMRFPAADNLWQYVLGRRT